MEPKEGVEARKGAAGSKGAELRRVAKALWRYPVLKGWLVDGDGDAWEFKALCFLVGFLALALELSFFKSATWSIWWEGWNGSGWAKSWGMDLGAALQMAFSLALGAAICIHRRRLESMVLGNAAKMERGERWLPFFIGLPFFVSLWGSWTWAGSAFSAGFGRVEAASGIGRKPMGLGAQLAAVALAVAGAQAAMAVMVCGFFLAFGSCVWPLFWALSADARHAGSEWVLLSVEPPLMALVFSGLARAVSDGCGFPSLRIKGLRAASGSAVRRCRELPERWRAWWAAQMEDDGEDGAAPEAAVEAQGPKEGWLARIGRSAIETAEREGVLADIESSEMDSELADAPEGEAKRL